VTEAAITAVEAVHSRFIQMFRLSGGEPSAGQLRRVTSNWKLTPPATMRRQQRAFAIGKTLRVPEPLAAAALNTIVVSPARAANEVFVDGGGQEPQCTADA
jgi:hypothetical protein